MKDEDLLDEMRRLRRWIQLLSTLLVVHAAISGYGGLMGGI